MYLKDNQLATEVLDQIYYLVSRSQLKNDYTPSKISSFLAIAYKQLFNTSGKEIQETYLKVNKKKVSAVRCLSRRSLELLYVTCLTTRAKATIANDPPSIEDLFGILEESCSLVRNELNNGQFFDPFMSS